MNIDFLKWRKLAYTVTFILIAASVVSFLARGFNFGIDFRGGSLMQLRFPSEHKGKVLDENTLRDVIGQPEFHLRASQVIIQRVRGGAAGITEFIVNTEFMKNEDRDRLKEALTQELGLLPGPEGTVRVEQVGPAVGEQLQKQAFWALFWALVCILLYITYRFEFRFGVAAVVALIHDCLITLGFFSMFGKEISIPVVAALLTIIGYSLNDTIVISDRIRENFSLLRKKPFQELVNTSLNQSFSRTINTSLTTLFPVTCLWLLGGPILENFGFALFIGVLIGTYSSIFVVSPILIAWNRMSPHHR